MTGCVLMIGDDAQAFIVIQWVTNYPDVSRTAGIESA